MLNTIFVLTYTILSMYRTYKHENKSVLCNMKDE